MNYHRIAQLSVIACVALAASGCNLFKPDKRNIERRIRHFTVHLSNSDWSKAYGVCDKKQLYTMTNGRKYSPQGAKVFIARIKAIKNHRAFYMDVVKITMLEEDKFVAVVDCRHQTTEGIIDVGNFMWRSQLVWVRREKQWYLQQIKDLSERTKERSQ
jgi:hypothetical protein